MIRFSSDNGKVFEEAFAFAQEQVRRLTDKYPDFCPMYTKNGKWKHEGPAWTHWCDGFLPGMMWIFRSRAEPGSAEARYWPFSLNRSARVRPAWISTSFNAGSRVSWYQR